MENNIIDDLNNEVKQLGKDSLENIIRIIIKHSESLKNIYSTKELYEQYNAILIEEGISYSQEVFNDMFDSIEGLIQLHDNIPIALRNLYGDDFYLLDNNLYISLINTDILEKLSNDTKIYFIDNTGKIINNFIPLDKISITKLIIYNIAPYNAEKLRIFYDGDIHSENYVDISINKIKKLFGKRLFRIGLLSDIHYNDTSVDMDPDTIGNYDGSEYEADLVNALSFYQNKENVDFMCMAGDISTDSKEHLRNFKLCMDKYCPDVPMYGCFGNHDFQATNWDNEKYPDNDFGLSDEDLTRLEMWNKFITPLDYEINYYDKLNPMGRTSYWFEKRLPGTNKSDIYVFLSLDYGVSKDKILNHHGWQIQAAQKMLDYSDKYVKKLMEYVDCKERTDLEQQYDYQFYDSRSLLWLKSLLNSFKDKRVFIFTHQFFPQKSGTNNGSNKYAYAKDYWRISQRDDPSGQIAYCLCGLQFEFLNKLNNEYPNTIWFSGHSHYKWGWQCEDPTINICNHDYVIYDPKNPYFEKEIRYQRKSVETIEEYPLLHERYYNSTNHDNDILRLSLDFDELNLPEDEYKVKIYAFSCYTPGRNIYTESIKGNKTYSKVYCDSTQEEYYLPLYYKTSLMGEDIKYNYYEFTINQSSNIILSNMVSNTGNWYLLGISSIRNINTGKEYINIIKDNINVCYCDTLEIAPIAGENFVQRKSISYVGILSNSNTAFNVHLPSLARPLRLSTNYDVALEDSEGAIMDIYEDYVDIRGIIFKDKEMDNNYINKYYPLSQYRINIPAN